MPFFPTLAAVALGPVESGTSGPERSTNMDLVSKPRGKSLVWLYFGLKADENGRPLNSGEAICRLCRKIVLAKGGNTTNLRSHLKRRHRADFFEGSLLTTPGAVLDTHGLDLNSEEYFEETSLLQPVSNQNYVPDAVLPPGEPWLHGGPSRAVLSLPSCLELCGVTGSSAAGPSSEELMKVFAKCHLQQGVIFGPYIGEVCRAQMPPCLKYAWAIRDDASFVYVDAADEDKSNWMRYVSYTSSEEHHNLVVFQFYRRIYYKVSQHIPEGAQLRVWIGKDYASLLGLGMGENVKCELGDKESVLRLLQDIQLVTLPEPSSSSLWSDCSQSQSPMPVMSEVTPMSTPETLIDSTNISALSSSSPLPSHPSDKYDFMPGTEKLVSTNARAGSCWYFVGFEADPAGRPLDRSLAVCKLCGEHVSCTRGAEDIQSHLINKHQIRTQSTLRDPSQTKGQQRVLSNPGALMTSAILLPANVTDAIANFLIQDLHPVGLVEGEGFKQLVGTLLPSYYKVLPLPSLLEVLLREQHAKGKMSLAQLLRGKSDSREVDLMLDHTAPIEDEPRRSGRINNTRDVSHSVSISVDIWNHNWQGRAVRYLTLWSHFIDPCFSFRNLALSTLPLNDNAVSLEAVEAQVKVMAREWGISQPNLILVGGEGRNKMHSRSIKTERCSESAEGTHHPNSTTFLERDDSRTPDEQGFQEPGQSSEALPPVPCFYSVVQNCVDEVMAHPVISDTLSQFQGFLSCFVQLSSQFIGFYPHNFQSLLPMLTKQEQAELLSWAHCQPTWNNLYPLLTTATKHRGSICDAMKEIEGFVKETKSQSSHDPSGFIPHRSVWKTMEDLCSVLKPLDVACRTLTKEDRPRLCLLKPILTGLLTRHLVSKPGDSSMIIKEVKTMIRQKLASCYNHPEINRVLCVACSLDPQFHGLQFMDEREQKETFDWLKKEAVRIVREQQVRQKSKIQGKRSPSPESESDSDLVRRSKRLKDFSPSDAKAEEFYDDSDPGQADDSDYESTSHTRLSGMEFLLGDLFSTTPKRRDSSVEESVDMEISIFRAEKGASLGVEPLQWWRTKAVQFPILAKVARVFLAAPAVIISSTHYFLQNAPGAISYRRDGLPPEILDTILFLHNNHMSVEGGQLALKHDDRI